VRTVERGNENDAELAISFEREALPLLDPLYRGALALTGDRLAAEDLLEEAMMNAHRQFGSLPDGTNLRASLYRLMTNAYVGSLRAQHRRLSEGRNDTTNDWHPARARERASTRLSSAEVEALKALPAAVFTEALQALRQDTRMVVYYADIEGFSYAEIAHITNRSVSAVMSLLYRGRDHLRHVLLASCREQEACEFAEDTSNNVARVRRRKSKRAMLQRLSEDGTCAGQLDWFDREIVRYVLLWGPHGGGRDEDVYPAFGMTVEQLVDRFHRIIATFAPRLDRLAKSDRELLDKARRLPSIFGQAR
ncbi:Mycobacterium rhizamassiliense ORFan, partial [Mycobacterium rhizamassiliense]|jgi:RNA polymerase sigma-70 factor (ECF subfamily)